jgi:energy-coupling factor transporter ATP-binding protein EcfA2
MIRLQSVHISRFRGIREGGVPGLADVNLLIGRNNSGKTTVVEAIMRLFAGHGGLADLLDRKVDDIWREIRGEPKERGEPEGLRAEAWHRQDQSQIIVLEGRLGDNKDPSRDTSALLTLEVQAQRGASVSTSSPDFKGGLTQDQVLPFASGVTLFRPLDALDRNIERKLWPRLLANRRDKWLTRALNEVFGLRAEGLQLLPDNRLMVLFEEHSLPLDVQGDGTRTATRALMVLTMLQGTLFLMEEPECHQHPGSLERFAHAICRLAREQEVQLLVSTHSAECVRSFLRAAEEVRSEGAVFHLTLENGRQQARRLDVEAVETLQSTGVDVRFLDLYG